MRYFTAFFVSCAVLTQTAAAQTPPPPAAGQISITGWRVECDSQAAGLNCRATDQAAQQSTNLVVAGLGVTLASDTKKPVLTIQVPLQLAVADPITVTSENVSQPFPALTCDRPGCFARAPITDGLLAKMMTSKQPLKLVYNLINPTTLAKQSITVTMPLDGFAASLDKIK
jgi:invasion protein IalB